MTHQNSAFYPPIEPFSTGRLKVSERHEIFYEEVGNKQGKPVIFLHGGPGAGLIPLYRQAFDPARYHIILLDQRGCGQSTPYGELRENTTWDLVADLEKLRIHLNIERWQVFGGSWGGTLAMAYAQKHPDQVTEMVLRGTCLWRKQEFNWMYGHGANQMFPIEWQDFVDHIPESEQDDLIGAYYHRFNSKNDAIRCAAAKQWGAWENCKVSLIRNKDHEDHHNAIYEKVMSLMECHYIVNKGWLEYDDQLLVEIEKIKHIPARIICGRYDIITPLETSYEMKQRWPAAKLVIVEGAGHSFAEEAIARELVAATDYFAKSKN